MRNYSNIKDREHVIFLPFDNISYKNINILIDELKQNPVISGAAFADNYIGLEDKFSYVEGTDSKGEDIMYYPMAVSANFLKLMDFNIIEGRGFLESDQFLPYNAIIINKIAKDRMSLNIGDEIDEGKIIGIVGNFNFKSLRHEIEPLFLMQSKSSLSGHPFVGYIKYDGNVADAVKHINDCLAKVVPQHPVEVRFYDQQFDTAYMKENNITRQITLFSLLAILISLAGIFGLVLFETNYRQKEIGVRKVFGANVNQILSMFCRRFFIIVLICFFIAIPLAYIIISLWLANFAYRTPIYWWVFILTFVIVAALTLFTVIIQSWRNAIANPIKSLKN